MLTYLIGSVRPNIVMAVHQCARFSKKKIHLHEQTVTKTGRYLIGSKTEGIVYNLDKSKGWKVYVDANFDGGWDPDNSLDANMLYSCTGFVICYVSCPVLWTRKLQTEIALFTTEAKYITYANDKKREHEPEQELDRVPEQEQVPERKQEPESD